MDATRDLFKRHYGNRKPLPPQTERLLRLLVYAGPQSVDDCMEQLGVGISCAYHRLYELRKLQLCSDERTWSEVLVYGPRLWRATGLGKVVLEFWDLNETAEDRAYFESKMHCIRTGAQTRDKKAKQKVLTEWLQD